MSEFLDKVRSIGTIGRAPKSRSTEDRVDGATIIHTEHADGRVDATVRPDTVEYRARTHSTGKKRGQVAEVTRKEART